MKDLKTFLNESNGEPTNGRPYMRELIIKVFAKYKTDRVDINELMQVIGSIGWIYDNKKSTDTQLIFYIGGSGGSLKTRINVNIIVKKYGNEVEMVDYTWTWGF